MTSPVVGQLSNYINKTAASTSTSTSTTKANELGKDDFLKLLVAQLKYQDPDKPQDASAFMAQTAQFTMVEKLTELGASQASMVAAQQLSAAGGMIGRSIDYTLADGTTGTGVVTSAVVSGSSPTLKVGNTDVPLSSVKEVHGSTSSA